MTNKIWMSILACLAAGSGLALMAAGCSHHAAPETATAQNAPEPLPLEPASETVHPYTVIDKLPPAPAKVDHSCQKLTLAHYDDRLCLRDADGQYFDCGRDADGHLYPVYYDDYTHQWCPLYYDGDRNQYYCVVWRDDHYYREYCDRPDCLYYDDQYNYADYNPPAYDRPVIIVSDDYYSDAYHHHNDWLWALPVIAAAFIALDNGGYDHDHGWYHNRGDYYAHRTYPGQQATGWWTGGGGPGQGGFHGGNGYANRGSGRAAIAQGPAGRGPGRPGAPAGRYAAFSGAKGHGPAPGHPAGGPRGAAVARHFAPHPSAAAHAGHQFAARSANNRGVKIAARRKAAAHAGRPAVHMAQRTPQRGPAGPGPRASHQPVHQARVPHAAAHFRPQARAASPRIASRPGGGRGFAPRPQAFHRSSARQGGFGGAGRSAPQPHFSPRAHSGGGPRGGGPQPHFGGGGGAPHAGGGGFRPRGSGGGGPHGGGPHGGGPGGSGRRHGH